MSRWKPSNRAALEEARCYRELNNRQQGTIEALSEAVGCLKSENAKLREDLEDQEGYDQMLRDRLRQQTELCVKAEAENAKLRKLLLDVWNDAIQFDDFWDYVNDDGEIYSEDELPHYQDRMRDLGVEVD